MNGNQLKRKPGRWRSNARRIHAHRVNELDNARGFAQRGSTHQSDDKPCELKPCRRIDLVRAVSAAQRTDNTIRFALEREHCGRRGW